MYYFDLSQWFALVIKEHRVGPRLNYQLELEPRPPSRRQKAQFGGMKQKVFHWS